ncbi:hypothetical protein DPX39_050005500 [Trypanosoma brucei equiperdum]|uniref:Uncharacterized protein n=1 Tax=Trypanosoma brucei equiperdum TaxID=630700 RepID=A0A3L6LA60_9TRYP|nr:hypothetical protein DPX39_050005500 [Trypanosoma brucei equiperdum]
MHVKKKSALSKKCWAQIVDKKEAYASTRLRVTIVHACSRFSLFSLSFCKKENKSFLSIIFISIRLSTRNSEHYFLLPHIILDIFYELLSYVSESFGYTREMVLGIVMIVCLLLKMEFHFRLLYCGCGDAYFTYSRKYLLPICWVYLENNETVIFAFICEQSEWRMHNPITLIVSPLFYHRRCISQSFNDKANHE